MEDRGSELDELRSAAKSPVKKLAWKWLVMWLLLAAAVAAAGLFYWLWLNARGEDELGEQAGVGEEHTGSGGQLSNLEQVIKKVGQFVILPEGEEPTLVTVTDKEELVGNQDFFEEAEDGDQVLIYQEAGMAYMYRPATNKIVNIAPIAAGEEAAEPSPTPNLPVKVGLRNGTATPGLTYQVEPRLLGAFPDLEIGEREAAVKTDYATSIVVMTDDSQAEFAKELADKIGAKIGDLPAGEPTSQDAILVILGADQVN